MLLEKSFKILSNIDILVALDKYNDFLTVTFVKCKITCVLSERDKKFFFNVFWLKNQKVTSFFSG